MLRLSMALCAACLILMGVIPPRLEQEIKRVEREIDDIEQQALAEWRALPIDSSTRMEQVQVLGKLLLFDKNLPSSELLAQRNLSI